MSCRDCEEFQNTPKTSYFRWGNANVEVRACERHMKEVYDVLRSFQRLNQGLSVTDVNWYQVGELVGKLTKENQELAGLVKKLNDKDMSVTKEQSSS